MAQTHNLAVTAVSIGLFFAIGPFLQQTSYPIKPTTSDWPQYVSANGSDENDGLGEKSAKRTVMAAYEALSARGGTIYIYDGAPCNSIAKAGIWIMGSTDPNYRRPPSGWARMKGGSVTFVGIPKDNYGPNAHMGRANAYPCGSSSDVNHPGIWISGVNSPLYFQNLNFEASGRGIVIGEDSNHGRTGPYAGGSSGVSFYNVTANPPQIKGLGPAWDIVGGSFWIYIMHCGASGLDAINNPAANNAAAMLLDGTRNDGIGYIFIDHVNLAGGGIKLIPGTVNPSIQMVDINEVDTESQRSPAAVWFTGQFNSALVQGVHVNDPMGRSCNGSVCAVENDGNGPAENIHVADVYSSASPMVKGPMLILSQAGLAVGGSPFVNGQGGFQNGYVYANTDTARRLFMPSAVRFPNQAFWGSVTGKLTSGIAAPDGTTGAVRLSNGSTTAYANAYFAGDKTISVGDILIGGIWARLNSGRSLASPYSLGLTGCKVTYATPGFNSTGAIGNAPTDGQWTWLSTINKIATVSNNPCQMQFIVQVPGNSAADFYAPIYMHIPAGTIPDTEAMMIFHNLSSYGNKCSTGTICGLPGQELIEDQYGTMSNCSSKTSPAVCGSASAGSIVVPGGSTTVVVNTTAVKASSQIFVTFDSSLGTKLGVTCDTTYVAPYVSARRAGESFTISVASPPNAKPECYSYSVIN